MSAEATTELLTENSTDASPRWENVVSRRKGPVKLLDCTSVIITRPEGNPNSDHNGNKCSPNISSQVSRRAPTVNQPKKSHDIPPIAILPSKSWIELSETLNAVISSELDAKCKGKFFFVYTKCIEDFWAIQRILSDLKEEYHTYSLPCNRELKVIICGISHSIDPDLIKKELRSRGFQATLVTPLLVKVNTFLVKLRPEGNPDAIYELQSLFHLRVTVRPFVSGAGFPQCFCCQRYGHSSLYCHHRPRCLKCSKTHEKGKCQKQPGDAPLCCNCGGTHSANYRGCPYYLEICHKIESAHKHRSSVEVHISESDLVLCME